MIETPPPGARAKAGGNPMQAPMPVVGVHLGRSSPLCPERLEPATRRAVLEFVARLVERVTR